MLGGARKIFLTVGYACEELVDGKNAVHNIVDLAYDAWCYVGGKLCRT